MKLQASIPITLFASLIAIATAAAAKSNQTDVFDSIKKFDDCVTQSTFSHLYSASYVPKTADELKNICRRQNEAFKCIKDKSKGTEPLIRRGMLAYVSARQRHHKKYCTNLDSELSKRFVNDMKCIRETNFDARRQIEAEMAMKLIEVAKKNYNDSGSELKQICCAFYDMKKKLLDRVGKDCPASLAMFEEMEASVVPSEMNIICDDEDKLVKICQKLDPLPVSGTFKPQPGNSPSGLALYLIATLGEPSEKPILT